MPRLGLLNMAIGFSVLFLSACAGAFLATDLATLLKQDPASLHSWSTLIQQSAHGHTNLFGMIHVLFGLSLPYSRLSSKVHLYQTIGFFLGVVAMGPLMLIHSALGLRDEDVIHFAIGFCLSCSLVSLLSHAVALFRRVRC